MTTKNCTQCLTRPQLEYENYNDLREGQVEEPRVSDLTWLLLRQYDTRNNIINRKEVKNIVVHNISMDYNITF